LSFLSGAMLSTFSMSRRCVSQISCTLDEITFKRFRQKHVIRNHVRRKNVVPISWGHDQAS
jgi:hypothetical protein